MRSEALLKIHSPLTWPPLIDQVALYVFHLGSDLGSLFLFGICRTMAALDVETSVEWVTRRRHLQISQSHVIPVIFKSRSRGCTSKAKMPRSDIAVQGAPPAFPETEVHLSDSMPLLKQWLKQHIDRVYRLTPANLKPGTLETPDVLRDGIHRFTVWLEPSAATFALFTSRERCTSTTSSAQRVSNNGDGKDDDEGGHDDDPGFHSFTPTPQTLHIIAEMDD